MATENPTVSELLQKKFKHNPTTGQTKLFELMDDFLEQEDEIIRSAFILKGYAGTGKTTFISALVKVLPKFGWKSVLLAPTGRAAKVMATYSRRKAQTIHKKIYRQTENSYTGNFVFERQKNYHEDTLFIVDEASMISDTKEFGSSSLLHDLLDYIFENPGNKLLLIGDEAQLPPVKMSVSPALDEQHLIGYYHTEVTCHQLTQVTRQEEGNGILDNATALRNLLGNEKPKIEFVTKGYTDLFRMTGQRIEDGLRYAYDKFGRENVIVITRSNKNAVQYNQYIRNQIDDSQEELSNGDLLMVVRNNYTVLDETSEAGFIANGEFVQIKRVGREEEMHGFRFASVTLQLVDYPEEPEFDTLILLDTLHSHSPSLTRDENKTLYENVLKDYFFITSKKERSDLVRKDKYLNALQVKYAYALTCHKSQGGQWEVVFVDQGYLPPDQLDEDFIRWLYTGITRGIKQVFLVNFNAGFFAK
jgi:ATP-dependent exoDNAse (exonuclease V) alpha subunit